MKFFMVFALFALAAAKPSLRLDQEELVDIIDGPNTNSAVAAAIKEKIQKILALLRPNQVGPEVIDGYEPIHVGPTPVEIESHEPIQIGPEVIDFEPIHVGPEIIDIPVHESAVAPTPVSSPLVQIIVNVKKPEDFVGGSPVVVEGLDKPEPIEKPTPVQVVEHNPTPVQVVESNPVVIEPVIVADNLPPLPSEPINIAPVIISPIAALPEILN